MKKLWALPHLPGVLTHQIGDDGGAFALRSPTDRKPMQIIASNGEGWDHVSVSRTDRVPNWEEMEHVKRLFFEDWEVAMQLHVPPAAHISVHPNCLHMWRPQSGSIPMPQAWMVA
jgi:hypothetical protein